MRTLWSICLLRFTGQWSRVRSEVAIEQRMYSFVNSRFVSSSWLINERLYQTVQRNDQWFATEMPKFGARPIGKRPANGDSLDGAVIAKLSIILLHILYQIIMLVQIRNWYSSRVDKWLEYNTLLNYEHSYHHCLLRIRLILQKVIIIIVIIMLSS